MVKKAAEDARMAKLYREVVLKEKPVEAGFVPLDTLGGIKPAAPKGEEGRSRQLRRLTVGCFNSSDLTPVHRISIQANARPMVSSRTSHHSNGFL